jgi:S1-C subfamily serine protease
MAAATMPGPMTTWDAMRVLGLVLALLLAPDPAGSALARSPGADERSATGRVKSGTGFFVSPDGFLVTSAHVVSGCRDVSVWQSDGTEHPGRLLAVDRRLDVALLWADGLFLEQSAMVTRARPVPGGPVVTLGYGVIASKPLRPVLVEGWLVGNRPGLPGNRFVIIRARLHAGHSGAALLAGDGSLLGMVVGREEERPELGVAIPKDDIEALLSAYGITLPQRDPAPNPRDFLGAISVLIQCSSAGAPGHPSAPARLPPAATKERPRSP